MSKYFDCNSFSKSGPNVPGSTSTIPEISSTETIPCIAVTSRTIPPYSGTAEPHTPLRPPATVSGKSCLLHTATNAATCSVVFGVHTAPGLRGVLPCSAQCMASGHQSRPWFANDSSSTEVAQIARNVSRTVAVSVEPPEKRSVISSAETANSIGSVG